MRPFRFLLSAFIVFAVLGLYGRAFAERAEERHPASRDRDRDRDRRANPPPRDRHDRQDRDRRDARDDNHRYDQYRRSNEHRPTRYLRHYGFNSFSYSTYNGRPFGPHYRLFVGRLGLYWPYYDTPASGCNLYWVPTTRSLVFDRGQEYWEYSDYRRVRLCFD